MPRGAKQPLPPLKPLPDGGPSGRCAPRPTLKTAIWVCRACPVRDQCLDYALSGADTWGGIATGIWGGTTPAQRDQLRQRKAVAA
jgi:hypothetical protein